MGEADGNGVVWRAPVGGSLGRAGQASCTLLPAGRFLMGGEGGNAWGVRQSASASLHHAGQPIGWEGE